jgi:hypothetical protein
MRGRFSDQANWGARSQEARILAERVDDPIAKRAILDIATNYDIIAKRAEALTAGVQSVHVGKSDKQ